MNERIRIDIEQAAKDGESDGLNLIAELCNPSNGNTAQAALFDSLADVVGLAMEQRPEECQARLAAFCQAIGPLLDDAANRLPALQAKGTLMAVLLRQDEADLGHIASGQTESEGGEL